MVASPEALVNVCEKLLQPICVPGLELKKQLLPVFAIEYQSLICAP